MDFDMSHRCLPPIYQTRSMKGKVHPPLAIIDRCLVKKGSTLTRRLLCNLQTLKTTRLSGSLIDVTQYPQKKTTMHMQLPIQIRDPR